MKLDRFARAGEELDHRSRIADRVIGMAVVEEHVYLFALAGEALHARHPLAQLVFWIEVIESLRSGLGSAAPTGGIAAVHAQEREVGRGHGDRRHRGSKSLRL